MQSACHSPSSYLFYDPDPLDFLNNKNDLIVFQAQPEFDGPWNVGFNEHDIAPSKRHSGKKKKKKGKGFRYANNRMWADLAWKKKTHIHKFHLRQKKHKRPSSLPDFLLLGPRFVRYGHFCGIRDSRPNRCPFKGIAHKKFIASCKTCACQALSIYPSPLASVIKSDISDKNFDSLFECCGST